MAILTAVATTGIEHLDPDAVLAGVGEAETAERRAGLAKLELALRWCVLHPATDDTGLAVWGDAAIPGLGDCEESLGGDGCPTVSAFAPEPFAAALGVSTFTGMQLLADALDLAHRLPKTWARVQRLEVAPWRARRLAQATHGLTQEAAAHVDRRVAARIDSCGAVLIDRLIAEASARFDPEARAEAEQVGKASWDVRLLHRSDGGWAGTSHLDATGDTADLTRLYDVVCEHAAHLARLGDTDSLGARKAKALGLIADAQSQLDLCGPTDGPIDDRGRVRRPGHDRPGAARGRRPCGRARRRPARPHRPDPRGGRPARPALRVPVVRRRRPGLRPGPHRPLRPDGRGRPTRPDRAVEAGLLVPATSQRQDRAPMAISSQPRRHLHLARPPRPPLSRHLRRHHRTPARLRVPLRRPARSGYRAG